MKPWHVETMSGTEIRPMRADDWVPAPIEPGRYANPEPLTGFRRRDGQGGNDLHPVHGDEGFEEALAERFAALRAAYPEVSVARYAVQMPYWRGRTLPSSDDYPFVSAPQALTTTSITVVLVPDGQVREASMGYYFCGHRLPSLRERMRGTPFRGIAGNLGYYMTAALIGDQPGQGKLSQAKAWAHNVRYPGFPLPTVLSYIGFHLVREGATGQVYGSFAGAHPAAVGIRHDGAVEVLPRLEIARYEVTLGGQGIAVDAIDDPDAVEREVVLFTPALRTGEVKQYIALAEAAVGAVDGWQTYAAMVPLADVQGRVHVFVANEGDGRVPVEKAIAVWEGAAPVPSFGAVLSFKRAYFESLFGGVEAFKRHLLGQRVHIVPLGHTRFDDYVHMMGGFVPAVVDGEHVFCAHTVDQVMRSLSRHSSANSPIAQAGQESRNLDPYIREPAGLLVQAESQVGWVLFDGRHELSIGASVVDVGMILHKMRAEGMLPPIQQAVFIDGGSAMKVYHIVSDGENVDLAPLNRIAAGSRNKPGADPDGLNLYTLLALRLAE